MKPKQIPQRTYTRKGTIFKTVDCVRRKFGKRMNTMLKFTFDVDEAQVKKMIESEIAYHLSALNSVEGIEYKYLSHNLGQDGYDFIRNVWSVLIKFERVKPE